MKEDTSKWPRGLDGKPFDPRIIKANVGAYMHPDSEHYKSMPREWQRLADETLAETNAACDRMLGKNTKR